MEILGEIRRTAALNGGSPLGRRRFEKLTGIRESDWAGIHWARWSEALAAAGFAPNAPSLPHSREALLGSYIRLARELGRLPSDREWRMRRRQDPAFPDIAAFRRHFGGRPALRAALADHCRARAGFDDILRLLETARPIPARPTPGPNPPPRGGSAPSLKPVGYVYLLQCGDYFKIGRTTDPSRREQELSAGLPERAHTLHTIKTDDPPGIESYWHRRFADRRTNGEWFTLTPADLSAFRSRRVM